MSRVRQELSVVQFQVQTRQASASMDALREKAKDLNRDITTTQNNIKALGDVSPNDAALVGYQQQLKRLKSDLNDVTRAQNELVKGVKAADKLWKAAETGTMESLSVKEIKTGQRGMQARMQNLQPSKENADMLRAMKAAIEEGDIAIRKFEADTAHLLKTISEGGNVSSSALSKAKTDLQGLIDVLPNGTKEWNRYNQQLTTVSEKLREMTIEQQRATGKDTLGRAFRGDFAGADAKTLEQTITKLKEYQSVIDDPRGKGARHFAAAETQIKQLQSTLDQLKGKYTSADEVIQRFNQHLGETKMENVNAQARTLAQTLDEKLSQATWQFDEQLNDAAKDVDDYERQLKEATEELAKMEAELAALEKKHANSSWFRKRSFAYKLEAWRIDDLREGIEGEEIPDMISGGTFRIGQKANVERKKEWKAHAQEQLDWWKRQKAEALGLTETVEQLNQAELQGEEKKQEARRMTREQMQQGIKVLEDEAFTIDRTTAEGKARYEQLRQTIDQMNEEIKVAANEMMSFADAQALADKAMEEQALTTKTGWAASTEELKRAEQTLADKVAKAKRGTAEEEAAYQKLVRQLQAVRTELGAGSMSGKQMMDVLSNPKNVTSVDTLKAAIGRARQELDALGRRLDQAKQSGQSGEVKKLQKVYDDLAKSVRQTDIRMKELQNSSKGTASAFEKAWSRLKTYVGLYVGAAVAMQKLTAAMGDLLTLSDKMGEVRKTTGFTADEVGRLSENLAKLDTRTTLTQLMELSSLAGSVGLKTQEQVQGFTEAADQLIVALPELGNESARTIIKIANATGDLEKNGGNVRETLEKVGSTIIALRANSASAAGPITDFVSRVGAVGAQAGISIDQIAALGSTIDALGGRVEMSATALSRMIPAIKNNSFAIANSINVTEEYLKSLAPMEQMVLIFQKMRDNIQHIDISTEEGMNAMADNVEAMLGKNATMREVMKDLEQQGARAGIVFGLLSQNVDELQKQLGIASEAYRENTALANEFANMNETTAAKWERLKNKVEEMFVGDQAQRFLGTIIDGLRTIIDLLTGPLAGTTKAVLTAMGFYFLGVGGMIWKGVLNPIYQAITGVHSLGTTMKRTAATWRAAWKSMDAASKATLVLAIASAVYQLGKAIWEAATKVSELDKALANLDNQEAEAERSVYHLVGAMTSASTKTEDARKKQQALEEQTKALREEVDKMSNSKDKSKEATDRLNQKEEELKESEKKLKEATDETNKARGNQLKLINEFNSKYSTYLGYLLDEKTATEQVALAHMQVVAALKEELEQKRLNRQTENVDEQYNEKLNKAGAGSRSALSTLPADMQRRIESQWNTIRGRIQYNVDEQGKATYTLPVIEGLGNKAKTSSDYAGLRNDLEALFLSIVRKEVAAAGTVTDRNGNVVPINFGTRKVQTGTSTAGIAIYSDVQNTLEDFAHQAFNYFNRWTDLTMQREQTLDDIRRESEAYAKGTHANSVEAANAMNADAYQRITATLGTVSGNQALSSEVVGTLAQQANIITANLAKYKNELKDADKFIGKDNDASLKNAIDTMYASLTEKQRQQILAAAQRANSSGGGGQFHNGSNSPTPYGTYNRVTSPYQDWDADALVSRRKEMLERVRALANGADVKAVLSEDAKFITEATRNNIKTTKQAIEWYNTERLKIQDALKEKHLTNTGDWRDDTEGGRKRKPQFYESDYALAELDRYYSRRKEALEKAREEENMTEELYNREAELLEQEHLAKRSKLRETFTSEDKQMIEQFRAWWATLAETGDLAEVPWATVESEWSKATDAQWGANNRKAQEDLTALQGITVKHLNAIAKIIDKERPYDGITANLRDNLLKMDILLADYQKNGPTEDTAALVRAQTERLKFLLGEAEHAYTSTIEDVLRRMGEAGMTAWAEEIRRSPAMQNALMAQLQTAYDEIQNAIKKEATLIKKQTDIWWNDIAQGQTQSRKGGFEKMLSDLGLSEDRVKRANALIGAGQASERVADKLAIAQMKVRLQMQETYYQRMRQMWADRIASLRAQGKEIDAQHAEMSRNLSLAEEQKKLDEQRVAIANQMEESENRLYTSLREWGELFSSSLQGVFEASNTGQADFYTEQAKKRLTGDGTSGSYIVVDHAGTAAATASYQTLSDQEVLDIEQRNAMLDAWKKLMDDLNMKMSETITDQLNAMLQNESLDANTQAIIQNTKAIYAQMGQGEGAGVDTSHGSGFGTSGIGSVDPSLPPPVSDGDPESYERYAQWVQTYNAGQESMSQKNNETNTKIQKSTQSAFAKMTQAANLYGIAYQAMANDNMSAAQKFGMIAVQAAGQSAISMLTANLAEGQAKNTVQMPGILGKLLGEMPFPAAMATFAIVTGLMGGLMGLAASQVAKSKSEIAQVTGVSGSAGRMATGMLTYAKGNVNEFTDPSSLTPGRQYNVDAADGKTYRARYMGKNPKTHLTNGPEFHLSGERGREMIIDAGTTRQITMNESEIWHAIQTLSGSGRISSTRRRRGIRAFAEGNISEFSDYSDYSEYSESTASPGFDPTALQASLDRNSAIQEALLERLNEPIVAQNILYGPDGLPNILRKLEKKAQRHGEQYL